jgi:hypothetical protein
MDAIMALAHTDVRYAGAYRLALDAYCMQHPEEYCISAKSYAAHLTGLCCGLEHHGNPNDYWAIARWLNGPTTLQRPLTLPARGTLNVAYLQEGSPPAEYALRVREWAASVWEAYASQQPLARDWLHAALAHGRPSKHP